MYKKFTILFLVIFMVISVIGCSNQNKTIAHNTESRIITSEGEYVKELNFNEVIYNCTNIVVAQAIDEEAFSGSTNVYRYRPIENIVGSINENEIYVYDSNIQGFSEGEKFILFLEGYESSLYPHTIYTSYYDTVLHLNNDDTVDYLKYGGISDNKKFKNKSEVVDFIRNSHSGIVKSTINAKSKKLKSNDINQLVLDSEYIAIIKPQKIETINPMVQIAQCKVTKNFKNILPEDILVTLPAEAEIDKEYVVLLNEVDGGSYTISSINSFIAKEDQKSFEKLLNAIKNNNITE
ncbi:hypothetical protein [Clostridium thermarum]|uniref:hypothetical protein n=1 Tax=Clostridium thermarum TaxID=1716543 RepID=UPI00112142A7|nr:hypothetical protein [Clostridium thermarum]